MSAAEVRDFLRRHSLLARRDLGQNFLWDEAIAERIAALSGVGAGDAVIEIGTGLGVLTRALAPRVRRVITLEVDAGIVRALRSEARLPENAELVHVDALRADLRALVARAGRPVRVVANLPYSISGPMLRRLLDLRDQLSDWSVMLQREVAQRLLAAPGSRAYGSLSVLHRLVVSLERLLELPAGCFHPAPRVRSTLVRAVPLGPGAISAEELERVEKLLRAAFGRRRKTLRNALGPEGGSAERIEVALAELGIDPRARAESLAPEQFLALARALAGAGR